MRRAAGMVCPGGAPVIQKREAMTSRQPGAMPPRIAGHAEAPGDGSEKPDGGERAGAGLTAQDWLVRLLPVALLIGRASCRERVFGYV